ncbi:hypothetical protein TWF481_006763 [Arthrobotrys musiformis]|uniref:Uncharacterized protein n=1 Tax=Arthrobotrys musiformis TaxID=47236 RepID=A0AAV9W9G4_9PEZI
MANYLLESNITSVIKHPIPNPIQRNQSNTISNASNSPTNLRFGSTSHFKLLKLKAFRMNRLPVRIGRLSRVSHHTVTQAHSRTSPSKLGVTQINQQNQLSTSNCLFNNSPAGTQERPELPSDKSRTAQSPKSSDEKILDRAHEAEKGKAPFTEEEQKRKQLDKKEGYGEGEAEEFDKSRRRNT